MDAYGEMEPEGTGEQPLSAMTTDTKREPDNAERDLVELRREGFARVLAHEIFHCVQE